MPIRLIFILLLLLPFRPSAAQTAGTGSARKLDTIAIAELPASDQVMWPEYAAFHTPYRHDSLLTRSLYIRLNSTSYFKNNEYRNAYVTGESLIGIGLDPVLEYHPDKKTTFRSGAHLLKYFGEDNFDRWVPVLSMQYDATDHFSLVFGTLYGTVNHNLPEPVMDFRYYLTDNYENGIQFLWSYPQFRSELWLNWEQFLKPGDPFQEKFTAGTNSTFVLWKTDLFKITAPFAAVFRHRGGESDATGLPAVTELNMNEGLRLNWTFTDPFLKSVSVSQDWLEYLQINMRDPNGIPYGSGSYSRVTVDTKIGTFEAGYWRAHNFVAPHGMPIFQSVSQKDPLVIVPDREMLVLKYQLELKFKDYLRFVGRFEPYYHYDTKRLDHAWSLCLIFDDAFLLARTRTR